ncbi:LysR family pca operon transcriptional activator [Variovorax sp. TBS-050B]|uniref:LysR substrate-binding domain-containing protein n=1 Tax=Variovorax sp. TBS-050B TaxID=2940551 RepID=UPI002476097C|nr:LysR substrate-binding domain-containing protein [Variovorax sp. TBS-050B]MDH6591336.1 LysR family pca operon transcriptional activator [Variovorax sp. TBS-050B]
MKNTADLRQDFLRNVQLRHLRCLVAVAQERHLARAAERLSLSQPAVSKTLAELEAIIGARLVERSKSGRRGVQGLAPAGEQLLAHALRVLEALDASAQAVAPAAGGRIERLRIGALPSVAPALLPQPLARFRERWPAVQMVVKSAANPVLLDELRAGELDLVVGRMSDPRLMGGLSFELLYTEPLVFAVRAGHPLALGAARAVSVQAVLGYPLVVYGEGTVPRHHTESFLQARGLALPADALQTLDVAVARGLLAVSDAVWITPLGAARGELAERRLVRLRIETAGTDEPVGLLLRSDAEPSPPRAAMAALLREAAKRQGAPLSQPRKKTAA